jgi:hypothetical protein
MKPHQGNPLHATRLNEHARTLALPELPHSDLRSRRRTDQDGGATLHTLGAFLMLIFLIVHVYLTTTGHTPLAHIRAMVSGWEDRH